MIFPDEIIDDFIGRLKLNAYFDDKKIMRAFPHSVKPTLPRRAAVVAGIKEIALDEASIGENVKRGSISIYANIYIPFTLNGVNAEKIVCQICKSIDDFNIASIRVSETAPDMKTECYVTKTVFTFNDEFMLGGVSDEQ